MQYKKTDKSLQIDLQGDFNLSAVREIKHMLDERQELIVDLERSRFVNSEAVFFLHKSMNEGKKVRLKNPPKIFFEVLHILGLHETWDLKQIVER